ncbi:MAG: DUF1565 domain-containing protein, partial [Treponema sp.]|nr:DUF1565 domain-containing protein [Treponema sp.]
MEYHVSPAGCDQNPGTRITPFKTISRAAAVALPGDTVTVHEGVYREWVNPANGGTETRRITYQAAPGEKVVISGAEPVTEWEQVDGNLWKTVIDNILFGAYNPYYNPYREKIFGDWLFVRPEKTFHTGEVYFNGKSMYEAQTLDDARNPAPVEESRDKAFSVY